MTNFSPFGRSPAGGQKLSMLLLRLGLGVLFFWAGWTKVIDPKWSAAGYLAGAKTFKALFAWFASPGVLPVINFLNEWGLTLIGVALILGISVRLASFFGIILMVLYYLPTFPPPHGWIDEHIVYSLAFLMFIATGAGEWYSLGKWFQNRLHPTWHKLVD